MFTVTWLLDPLGPGRLGRALCKHAMFNDMFSPEESLVCEFSKHLVPSVSVFSLWYWSVLFLPLEGGGPGPHT